MLEWCHTTTKGTDMDRISEAYAYQTLALAAQDFPDEDEWDDADGVEDRGLLCRHNEGPDCTECVG